MMFLSGQTKNRGGKIGMIPAFFQGEHCQFFPLAGPLPSHEAPAHDPPRRRKFSDTGER
jgi:hypothetical protein